MTLRVVLAVVLAFPAGWLVNVVADRVPERLALFRPVRPLVLGGGDLLVHAVVLVAFAAGAWRLEGLAPAALVGYLFLFGVLITVSVIDVDHMRIPDLVVIPSLVASAALVVAVSATGRDLSAAAMAALGAAVYFAFLLVVHVVYPRGMGFGDVKLAALMGLYLGWLGRDWAQSVTLVLWAMLVSFVAGAVVGVALLVIRRRNEPMPFGPFLALGTVAVVLVGPATFT